MRKNKCCFINKNQIVIESDWSYLCKICGRYTFDHEGNQKSVKDSKAMLGKMYNTILKAGKLSKSEKEKLHNEQLKKIKNKITKKINDSKIKAITAIVDSLKINNESTDSPYWLILDPNQNIKCDIHVMVSNITGLFFCRKDAENYLQDHRYNFSKRAKVYCLNGNSSDKYKEFCKQFGV
jgi:hypothetical protein